MFILTHPVNFLVGGNRSARRKPTTFGRVLTNSIRMSGTLGIGPATSEVKGERSDHCATEAREGTCTTVSLHMHYCEHYCELHLPVTMTARVNVLDKASLIFTMLSLWYLSRRGRKSIANFSAVMKSSSNNTSHN